MARTKSSACSAMRISKTACRKKQDDRLQSGDGRFLYPWYNYTICNHEIFRRYSVVPCFLPSAEGERFRRSGGLPPQARLAADGQAGHCRRLAAEVPVFTGGVRRAHGEGGLPPPGGGGKRGQGRQMVPLPPLDSPKPSFAPRLPSVARRNGGTGARFRASFSLRDAVSP